MAADPSTNDSLPTIRILLVEDEPVLRSAIAAVLTKEGYQVFEAGDGEHALRFLRGQEVDLIIADILMPGIDGIELIMELGKSKHPAPIIAMTGGYLDADLYLKVAANLGASRVISKPFKIEELVVKIREVLQ